MAASKSVRGESCTDMLELRSPRGLLGLVRHALPLTPAAGLLVAPSALCCCPLASRLLKEYKEIIKNRSTPSTDKQEIALFPPVSEWRDQLICDGH